MAWSQREAREAATLGHVVPSFGEPVCMIPSDAQHPAGAGRVLPFLCYSCSVPRCSSAVQHILLGGRKLRSLAFSLGFRRFRLWCLQDQCRPSRWLSCEHVKQFTGTLPCASHLWSFSKGIWLLGAVWMVRGLCSEPCTQGGNLGKKKENVLSKHLQHTGFGSDFASPAEIQRDPLVRGLRANFGWN